MEKVKNYIIDTDIGPDVDDVGALALFHKLLKQKGGRLLAVTNCTSNKYGCGMIDIINKSFGCNTVPTGIWEEFGFLDDDVSRQYNEKICKEYKMQIDYENIRSANAVLREALAGAEDKSVSIITIGPLNNLAKLLSKADGEILIKHKVKNVIMMAGGLKEPEWNVQMDISSARSCLESLKKLEIPVLISPFETGADIITGIEWGNMSLSNPIRRAYSVSAQNGRPSWDLTAVYVAIEEENELFVLSDAVSVTVEKDGYTRFIQDESSNMRLILKKEASKKIASEFDKIITE